MVHVLSVDSDKNLIVIMMMMRLDDETKKIKPQPITSICKSDQVQGASVTEVHLALSFINEWPV